MSLSADVVVLVERPHHGKRGLAPSVLLRRRIRSPLILTFNVDVVQIHANVRSIRPDDGPVL